MLQKFGEHIRGWFAGIIIALIAVAFVAWGLEYYIESDHGEGAAIATVNGEKITQSSFNQRYQMMLRQQEKLLHRGLTDHEMQNVKRTVLNQLISQSIIVQAVKKLGFTVNLAQVEKMIQSMPQFQVNGKFSPEILQQILYKMGYRSPQQLFVNFQKDQMVQQLVNGLRGSAFVTPSEARELYGLWQQKRDMRFVQLPIAPLMKKVKVTDVEVKQYYQTHKAQFMLPAKVKLNYILLSPKTLQKQVKVTSADVKDYYAANKGNFRVPASWHIVRITTTSKKNMAALQKSLKSGKTLTALAKQKRTGWQSVTQTIAATEVSPKLAEIFDSLKAGKVSPIIPTPAGPTVFEVLSRTKSHVKPLSAVAVTIKRMLISQQVQQLASTKSDQLSSIVFTSPTSLKPAAKATGLAIESSSWLTLKGQKNGVFAEQQVMNAAFSDSVLKQGNNSNPISLKDGGVIVLRVAQSLPAKEKPFAEVKNTITQTLKTQTALREVGLKAYDIQAKLSKGKVVAGLDWQVRRHVARNDPSVNQLILQTAFATVPKHYGNAQLANGYAIVQPQAVYPGNWDSAKAQQKIYMKMNLAQSQGANVFRIYVQSLMKAAKVDIKDKKLANSWS